MGACICVRLSCACVCVCALRVPYPQQIAPQSSKPGASSSEGWPHHRCPCQHRHRHRRHRQPHQPGPNHVEHPCARRAWPPPGSAFRNCAPPAAPTFRRRHLMPPHSTVRRRVRMWVRVRVSWKGRLCQSLAQGPRWDRKPGGVSGGRLALTCQGGGCTRRPRCNAGAELPPVTRCGVV